MCRGFRLTGLVGKGPIPWAKVGPGAFCLAVLFRVFCCLLDRSSKKEVPMAKAFAVSTLDILSRIGASIAAGALLA